MPLKMRLPLYLKILIGMALGVVVGFLACEVGFIRFVKLWITPWGEIFMRLLKFIAIPLVFVSLIKGVSGMRNIGRLSRIGFRTMAIYVATTVAAVILGAVMAGAVRPGSLFPRDMALQHKQNIEKVADQAAQQEQSPLRFIVDIVPDNAVRALGDNANMLQVIFVAMIFGVALVAVGDEKTATVRSFIDGLNDVLLRVVDYIMAYSPLGVFALMAGLVADFAGDLSIFTALGLYALTVVVSLFIIILLFYPLLLRLFTGIGFGKFFRAMFPVQMLAFSTSSSAATLPLTMDRTQKELGVPPDIASFVLPVGVTINMDGTSCYQIIATLFIAQVFGIELSFAQIALLVMVTTLSSIGTPGIPGGSVVMLMMVLSTVGIPAEGLALIMGIDRPLDMLRTVVNVTGDSVVACIITDGEKGRPKA